jgi:magnesium transporter
MSRIAANPLMITTVSVNRVERLAVMAAVTLPITSLSSVVGMNVIVNESTRWVCLLLIMLIMSAILLRSAHKQGWW